MTSWEVWRRQVQNTNTQILRHMKVKEGRTSEGLESKGIADLFSWMTWTPCTLWALISLSVKLRLGQMKAKAFSTSHSLGTGRQSSHTGLWRLVISLVSLPGPRYALFAQL